LAIISVISYSSLKDRFDAEFYKPEYIVTEERVKKHPNAVKFKEIMEYITNGATPYMSVYDKGEVRFLTAENIGELTILPEPLRYITTKDHTTLLKRAALKRGDLLITIKGRVGNATVVDSLQQETNINQDIARVVLKSGVNPYYVAVYFISNIGRRYVERRATGLINPFIGLDNLKEFLIPMPPKEFQDRIEQIAKEAQLKFRQADQKYAEAKQLLHKILGIDKLTFSGNKIYQVPYSKINESMRLDAEYYQPKYEKIVNHLRTLNFEVKSLGEVVRISDDKIDPPQTPSKKFRYIELADVNPATGEIEECSEIRGFEAPSRARMLLRKGDVLVPSLSGSLDNVALVPEELDNSIGSTGFFVINSELYYSEFLFLLFRCNLIKEQLKQKIAGTIMSAISQKDFKDILIPVIPKEEQVEAANLIKEFFKLRREGKELINQAKREVEQLIDLTIER
jgi:restriction endonuclease S subunit